MDMDQIVNVSHQKCHEKEHSGEYDLPGFRFHPTEQELLGFYLKKMVLGKLQNFSIIGVLDLYRYDPWDLPSLAPLGERQWFFFVPRDRKVQNGGRSSRITASGFWKGTGSDKEVLNENMKCIGLKKTLVFYKGRAPRGQRTDWVMNEYRMPDYIDPFRQKTKKDVVLCRIYRKATSLKSIEERAMSELAEEHVMHDQDMDCGKLSEETVFSDRDEKPIKYRLPVNSHEDCNTSAQSEPEMFSVTEILPIAPESCQCSALQLSQEVSSQQASHDNSSQIYASTATGLDLLEAIIGDDKKPSTEAFSVCKNDTLTPMDSFALNTDALQSTI